MLCYAVRALNIFSLLAACTSLLGLAPPSLACSPLNPTCLIWQATKEEFPDEPYQQYQARAPPPRLACSTRLPAVVSSHIRIVSSPHHLSAAALQETHRRYVTDVAGTIAGGAAEAAA